jgi:monoamine oxidase
VLIAKRLTLFKNSTVETSDFDIYRSSWRSNPNFGGAYSFPGVETNLGHWEDIAKPIKDQNWFFCGEHTYNKYRGTTHGAYLSGEVAAKMISKIKPK